MADSRSVAIATQVTGTTFYNPLRANAFAEELLSHEKILLPPTAQNTPRVEQIRQLNANKPFLNQLAAAWDKDPAILDKLSGQLSRDPALLARFRASMTADGRDGTLNTTSGKLAQYVANPTAATLNRLYPAPAAAPAATAAARPATRPATPDADPPARPRAAAPARPRPDADAAPRTETPSKPAARAAAPAPDVSPVQAAAGATTDRLTADDAKTLVQTLATQAAGIYRQADGTSEMDSKLASLNARLNDPQSGQAYAQQLANAFNSDPELLRQLTSSGEGGMDDLFKKYEEQTPEVQAGIRRGLKNGIEQFLDDPTKLANKQFRDSLAGTAQNSGMMAGINGFFKNIFGDGFDLQGIGNSIMSFLQPLIDMVGNLFTGFKASGGMANILSMGNGEGMIGNAMSSLSFAQNLGQAINANEASINRDGRAYDRTGDGKVSDGYEYGPDGKRVKETYTNSEGKEATRDKYDASKDDRIDVNGKKVFVVHGIDDGNIGDSVLRAYATKVDPTTGQILRSEIINIGSDGKITKTDPDTGENLDNRRPAPSAPAAPSQQMQTLGASSAPKPAGTDMAPNMATLGGAL